ncbi:MAG: alanine dehydrogenase [Flavobacteriales bacterium]|nr:alanine dehydrogenase [Flavobacteriales bacterium]
MKIGILREEKNTPDKRVIFSPKQCRYIKEHTEFELVVQTSNIRCFSDDEYVNENIEVVHDLSDCDILLGIKEVPVMKLIAEKTYFFFSHTIKKQMYNRSLLKSLIAKKIKMVDYEVLKENNTRLLGFGKYAGIVGAYNAFLTYGKKFRGYKINPAHNCYDINEFYNELKKVILTKERILITGRGRVATGILEVLKYLDIKSVSKEDFINNKYNDPIYCQLDSIDYYKRIDDLNTSKHDLYSNPRKYKSIFMNYANHADIYIAGHFYDERAPFIYTQEDVMSPKFKIKVVADISCDIAGPIATTIRPSSISSPIYGYNPLTGKEDDFMSENVIAVMAVDNLPCELPRDSSVHFGDKFIKLILPLFNNINCDPIISSATICENGALTNNFDYLREFVNHE